jgi:pseudouridine synthase
MPAPRPRPRPRRATPVPPAPSGGAVRINRYLGMCGVSSRRKAEELVLEGKVRVNGVIVTDLATRVDLRRDRVTVSGADVAPDRDTVYLVLNKPRDAITTAKDERGRRSVMDLLRVRGRVFPVGRLDRNTTGVLLFTNDGEFAHRLMHPRVRVPKSYHVFTDRAVAAADLASLRTGIRLSDGPSTPAEVYVYPGKKGKELGVVIHEGRNRQVHRMFESLGYTVEKLDRVAYGPVTTEGLARGETRSLTRRELRGLRALAGYAEPGDLPDAAR